MASNASTKMLSKHKLLAFIIISLSLHFICIYLIFKPQHKFIFITNNKNPSVEIELVQKKFKEELSEEFGEELVEQLREQPNRPLNEPQNDFARTKAEASSKTKNEVKNPNRLTQSPIPHIRNNSPSLTGSTHQTVSYTHVELGIKITYPRLSRLLKEEGKVVLSFKKNSFGHEEPLVLLKSSGFRRLDRAALEALTQYKSHPLFLNLSPNSELKVSFTFQLRH